VVDTSVLISSATGSELSSEGEQNLTPARRISSSFGKTSSSISS
jgi:hypothetical protein